MNFNEINKKRNELQEKLNEAVNLNSFENLTSHMVMAKSLEKDILSEDCKFLFTTEGGRPQAMIYGSRIQLAVAIHTFLEAEGNFYENLRLVLAFHEMKEMDIISVGGKTLHPESREQSEVMIEMYKNGWDVTQQ